nr:GLPGLI family protein [uncultured Bacteroides sp.]
MKYLSLLVLVCGYFTNAYPQYQKWSADYMSLSKYDILDAASLKCTYKFTHLFDTLDTSSIHPDIHTLLIGKEISKYYSQNYIDYCTLYEAKQTTDELPIRGTCGLEVFKDYPQKGKMTVTDLGGEISFGTNFIYEENMPEISWEIQRDTMSILFYKCQKATAEFRGRKYEAWFTTAIPFSNGPWKLGGLPGLILKAEDDKKEVTFECIGIERLINLEVTRLSEGRKELVDQIYTEPIKLYKAQYRKVSREEAEQNIRELLKDTVMYWFKHDLDREVGYKIPPIPYNPLEKD